MRDKDKETKSKKEMDVGVFPSVSKSVPVSAFLKLAAIKEGVLGARNRNSANCASSLFLTVSPNPKSTSVHHTTQ